VSRVSMGRYVNVDGLSFSYRAVLHAIVQCARDVLDTVSVSDRTPFSLSLSLSSRSPFHSLVQFDISPLGERYNGKV